MKTFLIAFLLAGTSTASIAYGQSAQTAALPSIKVMPYSDAQMDEIQQHIPVKCHREAIAAKAPNLADPCIKAQNSFIHQWKQKYTDSTVPVELWNSCYETSGAKKNRDIASWVICINQKGSKNR